MGDAAIQDALIANIRSRLPHAQFSGITLNSENFIERHGIAAYPLCETNRPFYGMSRQGKLNLSEKGRSSQNTLNLASIKTRVRRIPVLGGLFISLYAHCTCLWREIQHCVRGYQFLRRQELLIVSGGGQIDEEWGGPWGHPFALFKWAILARIAQIPFVIASVGACKATSTISRVFLFTALRMACYRSYRDINSRSIACGLLQRAARDPVVPDLAFSLSTSTLHSPSGIRGLTRGKTIIAISPIAYARPESWPHQDRALYERYLQQMALAVSHFLKRDYFLVMVWSALADRNVIFELVEHLDCESKERLACQVHIPAIARWQDFAGTLLDIDILIASRLHSTIFGFVTRTPTLAISFDPKVDWVMNDLGQKDYLLQIRTFTSEDVIQTLDLIQSCKAAVVEKIASYQDRIYCDFMHQYDCLAKLAVTGR